MLAVICAEHNGFMSDNPLDKLITRDPATMEHALEDAEYAGSDTLEGLDSGLIEVRAGNLGGVTAIPNNPAAEADQNPGYTPPSKMVAPHPHEGAADLPEGAPAEDELDRGGLQR